MRRSVYVVSSLIVAFSCAGEIRQSNAAGATASDSDTLERGGEQMPPATVQVTAAGLAVWAMTELPGGPRLQAAHAAIDAIVRAELAKYLEVRITTAMRDVVSEESQSVVVKSSEAMSAHLHGSAPIAHGWSKVRTDAGVVLRLVARMQVSQQMLRTAVTAEPTLGAESERVMRALVSTEVLP